MVSLRARLALVVLLASGSALGWLVFRTVSQLRPRYQEAMEEAMVDTANVLAAWLSQQVAAAGTMDVAALARAMDDARARELQARIFDVTKRRVSLDVAVTDARGIVLFDSADPASVGADWSKWNDVGRTLAGRYGARATRVHHDDPASAILHVAAPVLVGDRVVGVLTVAKPVDALTLFLDAARRELAVASLIVVAVAMLVAALATSWITSPIRRLTRHVEAVKRGSGEPLPALGDGEISALGRAFADLRAELDGRAYIERYVQTLTHEMKSPLSAIRGAAELLTEDPPEADRERFVANVAAEARRLHDLIDRLLQLAALERRAHAPAAEDIAAADLVADIVASVRPTADARGVALTSAVDPQLVVRGERFLVRQALANLIQNAIEFAPRGSTVEIAAEGVDRQAQLSVRDRGPGIPEYARPRVGERFFSLPRPDTGRKGTGLGVAFAREVAAAHGGSLRLEPRADGGTAAILRLPGVFTVASR